LVRKKVYKKQHILAAASDLLENNSFSAITARNVAEHMGISTQPIYLEFKNMDDLKVTLLQTIYASFEKEYFSINQSDDLLVSFSLNYITLAKARSKLFIALFVDQHSYVQHVRQLTFELFKKCLKTDKRFASVSLDSLEKQFANIWLFVTGMAALSISGILELSDEEVVSALKKFE
jgi:AcrR family transcriptional regulator